MNDISSKMEDKAMVHIPRFAILTTKVTQIPPIRVRIEPERVRNLQSIPHEAYLDYLWRSQPRQEHVPDT